METTKLRRFAQYARRTLLDLVETRLQLVLQPDSAARREAPAAVKQLETQIQKSSREQVIDRVAYTWFNRLCALRYMDVNRINRISVVSPLDGQFQPEILAEAKMGHIDEEMVPAAIQAKVRALLDGTAPSSNPQQEAYRLLVVAVCNFWQAAMPFLFEAIADYTELLMPDDLLSGNSILAYTREAMTPDACQDVEVIGWLYQFYISEKKDAVFEGLKKNKKITPENIPAATQLFTPHWIVRYLVENSLGRLWLLNRPNSRLAEQMDYYIAPQEPVTDFLHVAKPEDIKLCDPACGSGHMLTYSFDLLYAIYEEDGADPAEIPEKILTHNLYGIEIDERAAELAAFALTMKARGKQRRFLNKRIQPNICVLRPIKIAPQDLDAYVAEVGRDLFTSNLRTLLTQFEEADNFGSLIRPVAMDYAEIRRVLAEKGIGNQLLLEHVHCDVLRVLEQAEYLSQRYQVVVANPPYLGGNGMNGAMKVFAQDEYPNSKADTYSMFIDRGFFLVLGKGYLSMVTMETWMSLPRYELLRLAIFSKSKICSMVHMPYVGKGGTSMGINFGTTATIFQHISDRTSRASYRCVRYFETDDDGIPLSFYSENEKSALASISDFEAIPGQPVAHWVSEKLRSTFRGIKVADMAETRLGMATANNNKFLRFWHECSIDSVGLQIKTRDEALESQRKWFPYQKGGDFRRWYGNREYVVNWKNDGQEIQNFTDPETGKIRSHNYNLDFIFKEGITWSALTSSKTSFRFSNNALFDNAGSSLFSRKSEDTKLLLGFLNSAVFSATIEIISPSLNFQPGDIGKLPILFLKVDARLVTQLAKLAIELEGADWNSCETSWDFTTPALLHPDHHLPTLNASYQKLRTHWRETTLEMQRLEEENNVIFIDAYDLQDELTPDVPLSEITLTCNPRYRYGGNKSEQELEDLLRADTMREFISYAVGCMFGRYSLDKPGLILANQGETLEDYLQQVPEPRFTPDADNVIPLLDGDWFPDDITGRFRKFLRVTFGDEHYDENLRFIETALGKKGKPLAIRDFFLKDFYTDHVKRYKKRPIYWLFSSPKGSFNALIYLHRYRPDTASIVLQYLRDFRSKLVSERDHQEQMSISGSASPGEKTKALKRIEELKKILAELDDYERETLYPLATHQVALDLDDGVKVNYVKLGMALKKIPGLDAKDEG
jgi:type II restriction/modification system DNA methylase subunit YeeA